MRGIKHLLYVSVMVLLGSTAVHAAAETVPGSGTKLMYPTPSYILKNAYGYLGSLQHFSFDAVTDSDDSVGQKMIVTYTHRTHVDLERPGKLHVRMKGDLKNRSLYLFDGIYILYDHDLNYYGILKTPKTIDGTLDYLFENFNIKTILANLLYSDIEKRLAPKTKGYYFGLAEVDGVMCHHLGFMNKDHEFQVWVEKSVRPLIRKFIIIDKSGREDLRSVTKIRWNLHPNFKPSDFHFKVPEGAAQISIAPYRAKGGK
jgi:hypothetical protein